MTTTESQEIADLFRNKQKVKRTLPFKKISSHTYGKGALPIQHEGPGPGPDPGEPSPPRPDENW